MDLEMIIWSEVKSQMTSLICGIFKKGTNELTYKTEIESQMQGTNQPGREGREG